ncbi:MAG: efflux RND transporter periplasmic adaptor subunit [Burkholderiaceae bacterium]|jgi:RND family efflux transporter MFP subunit
MGLVQWHNRFREPAGNAVGRLVCATAFLWVALVLAACSKSPVANESPQPILSATVLAAPAGESVVYAGEVRSHFETPLSFRIAGQLKARHAHLGEKVRVGQALAVLDQADSQANLAQSLAAARVAEERLTLAGQIEARNGQQAQADLISHAEHDQSAADLAVRRAELEQSRQQIALAQNQARYTTLAAPSDGVITAELAEVGSVVGPGQAVFGFAWGGEKDILIDVPEEGIAAFAPKAQAIVTLGSLPGRSYVAHVRELAEASDPQSRTYRVKLALEGEAPEVRLGMTASARLANARATTVFRIPASALFHQGDATAVWVIHPADRKLELRKVSIARYGAEVVDLSDGIRAGEEIVAQGVHTVNAGQVVSPQTSDFATARP